MNAGPTERSPFLEAQLQREYRLFFVFLCTTCVLLMGWSMVAQLDIVSMAPGEVAPSGQVKKVQHLEGGIVQEILVKEGERVVAQQPIITLQATSSDADLKEISTRLFSLRLEIARLEAEAEDQKELIFPEELLEIHPERARQEKQLFIARMGRYKNQQSAYQELVSQREQDILQVQARITNSQNSLHLIQEQITISNNLLKDNLTNRYDHLELLRKKSELDSRIQEDHALLARSKAALSEAKASLEGVRHTFQEEARNLLEEKRREWRELTERAEKFKDNLQRTTLRSPVQGIIKSLGVFARGEVIPPGGTVADIVPEGVQLLVEALLRPQDVGYVHVGQSAGIQLASSDAVRFGKLKGKVIHISPDTITTEKATYYKVRIETERDYFQHKGWRYQLLPGVQVSAAIVIGQRSVLEYLLDPFFSSLNTALSEL